MSTKNLLSGLIEDVEEDFDDKFSLSLQGVQIDGEFVGDAIRRYYREQLKDTLISVQLLWDRMDMWQDEWEAEKPEERALILNDALRLIEWKMNKEYERGISEALEEARAKRKSKKHDTKT